MVPTRVPGFEDGIHVVVYDTCIFMVVFVGHKCTVSVYIRRKGKEKRKIKKIFVKKKNQNLMHIV